MTVEMYVLISLHMPYISVVYVIFMVDTAVSKVHQRAFTQTMISSYQLNQTFMSNKVSI